jgi:hypothetical protein
MHKKHLDEARLERFFYRLYAKASQKAYKLWDLLDCSLDSQRIMIIFRLTLTLSIFIHIILIYFI